MRRARLPCRLGLEGLPEERRGLRPPPPGGSPRGRPASRQPIFTPATKAESGHDENVTFDVMAGGRRRRPRRDPPRPDAPDLRRGRGLRGVARDPSRRHEIRVRPRRRRWDRLDRRGADARLLPLLAEGELGAGRLPPVVRQAVPPGLAGVDGLEQNAPRPRSPAPTSSRARGPATSKRSRPSRASASCDAPDASADLRLRRGRRLHARGRLGPDELRGERHGHLRGRRGPPRRPVHRAGPRPPPRGGGPREDQGADPVRRPDAPSHRPRPRRGVFRATGGGRRRPPPLRGTDGLGSPRPDRRAPRETRARGPLLRRGPRPAHRGVRRAAGLRRRGDPRPRPSRRSRPHARRRRPPHRRRRRRDGRRRLERLPRELRGRVAPRRRGGRPGPPRRSRQDLRAGPRRARAGARSSSGRSNTIGPSGRLAGRAGAQRRPSGSGIPGYGLGFVVEETVARLRAAG